jgi:recombinational DNA repair ATPase RecF
MATKTMQIIELRAENFKRITAVRIRPDGKVVNISGRNGQGKSSVMDSIWATIASMAEENDFQVWVETVGDGTGSGIIIEDGHIKEE